eukprot:TRINITY_DN40037_c0_g1_i1.p1 TRINITY_DN40037_c0_g1~~TRINITY_DN40037_c0_g1_i1.p1  ORF type:complete len:159 (+),score=44.70 TRINITY_DN40037_c0_g1_i1:23-499(+)
MSLKQFGIFLLCQLVSPGVECAHNRTIYTTARAPAPIGPYNQAVQVDHMLYVSGQIGLNPETMEMPEGVEEQAFQALLNIGEILKVADSGFNKVIKATVFLVDIQDFSAVNEIYKQFFLEDYPARAAVQVVALPRPGALVEIELVAVSGELNTSYNES